MIIKKSSLITATVQPLVGERFAFKIKDIRTKNVKVIAEEIENKLNEKLDGSGWLVEDTKVIGIENLEIIEGKFVFDSLDIEFKLKKIDKNAKDVQLVKEMEFDISTLGTEGIGAVIVLGLILSSIIASIFLVSKIHLIVQDVKELPEPVQIGIILALIGGIIAFILFLWRWLK